MNEVSLNPKTWLRQLKGAPLACLIALWAYGAGDKKHLIRRTGYKRDAVNDALLYLEDMGLVDRPHYRKWQISSGFYQLPLPFDETYKTMLAAAETRLNRISAESGENPEDRFNRTSDTETRLNRSSPLVVSSSNTNYPNSVTLLPQPDAEILAVCKELNIYGKKRDKLARLPHVVEGGAAYVEAHVAAVGRDDIGLAIWRMEQGWSAPQEKNQRRGAAFFICSECSTHPCMCEDEE